MLTHREGTPIGNENLEYSIGKSEISKPILLAMMGGMALSVIAGCAESEIETESYEAETVLTGGEEESVGEAKQESLIASFNDMSISYHQLAPASFSKYAGRRYTVCLDPESGDPDLYGHYSGYPNLSSYQFFSNQSGTSFDCIWFNSSSSGTYYLSIYGYQASITDFWIVDSLQQEVPSGFYKALSWPVPGWTGLAETNSKTYADSYSPFNSPWGNHEPINRPFYPGSENRIHAGVDIYVPTGTPVKAACTGPIKNDTSGVNSSLGAGWGYYTVQECTKNGTTISIAYDHVNSAGRPAQGGTATEGVTTMGTIFDMNVAGENDHLHLAICKDTYDNCKLFEDGQWRQYPQRGSLPHTQFPWKMMNPWIVTNPNLWK